MIDYNLRIQFLKKKTFYVKYKGIMSETALHTATLICVRDFLVRFIILKYQRIQ